MKRTVMRQKNKCEKKKINKKNYKEKKEHKKGCLR